MIFYLRWYNVICWSSHICRKSFSLPFYSFLMKFCEWHRESGTVMQVTCFLIGPMFNLLFYCHMIERKWFLWEIYEKKFLWEKYRNTKKYWNFEKFQLKWKIVKHFTRAKQQATLRKLFSLPQPPYHQIKSCYGFETKLFLERYTEIYRHFFSKCFMKVVLGRQEMVQCKCFFLHQTETSLLENV